MLHLDDVSNITFISYCIILSVGTISVICGIVNLFLIFYMNIWNQFILIIINLAASQLVYDITVFFYFCDSSDQICWQTVPQFLVTYTGITVTLWTNVMITTLYFGIIKSKPNILRKYFLPLCLSINAFGFAFASLSITMAGNAFIILFLAYNYFLLSSIIYNIIFIC